MTTPSDGPDELAGDTDEEALSADPAELFELYENQSADDETPVTAVFEVTKSVDLRLDRYLARRVPFLSRTQLQRLIEEQAVTVNGRAPKASTKLRRGDRVVATLPPPPSNTLAAENIPLDILFEDEHLIIVNKQPGLIVHPARAHKSGTLINALAWHFLHNSGGTLSTVKGTEVLNTLTAAGTGVVNWPEPTSGKCPVGAVKVKTVGVTFTLGTTDFSAANVTETWYDFAGGMPTAPLAS